MQHPGLRAACRALALLLSLALVAAPAHAQFGGLGKKLKQAAEDDGRTIPPPKYDSRTIEFGDRHLNALLADARGEIAARKAASARLGAAQKAYDDSMKVYTPRRAAWAKRKAAVDACVEKAQPQMDAAEQRGKAVSAKVDEQQLEAKMKDLEKRMRAAQQRGDNAEVARLAQEAQRLIAGTGAIEAGEASAAAAKALDKCGNPGMEPQEPRAPDPGPLDLKRAGVSGLGLSREQMAILDDRLRPLMYIQDDADYRKATRNGFSTQEQAALTGPGLDLRRAYRELNELKYPSR